MEDEIDPRTWQGPVCLVLAPFQGTWGAIHAAVESALRQDGVLVRWLNGDSELDKPIERAIQVYIEQADVVVADITEANPNIMYEVGYAHALRKPVLPVVDKRVSSVPAVVRGRLFYVYDRARPDEAAKFIGDWVPRHIVPSRREALVG